MRATDIVFLIAEPIAKECGLNVWDVVFEKEKVGALPGN